MIKILAIGNSFSQDATRYLQKIAESAGEKLFVRNLFIGGCSLETHAENIKTQSKSYVYQEDSADICTVSLNEALSFEEWDYVTVQQASHFSGKYETYEPYLTEVIDCVKDALTNAKIVFHRTWPYEKDSTHGAFPSYGCDRTKMYEAIACASAVAAESHELDIIGVGDIVYALGETETFDKEKGGVSLYRDGFHLGLLYGRYLAGLIWFKFFTGKSVQSVSYTPDQADEEIIEILKKSV